MRFRRFSLSQCLLRGKWVFSLESQNRISDPFRFGGDGRGLKVPHEILHQFASDIQMASAVAAIDGDKKVGKVQTFSDGDAASNYLNQYLSRECNLPLPKAKQEGTKVKF